MSLPKYVSNKATTENELEVDKQVILALSELLLGYLDVFACDVEAFCRHAKRTTVTAEDVLLCCRRNETLVSPSRIRGIATSNENCLYEEGTLGNLYQQKPKFF
eukprot:jgi/Galph1/5807/GphlegSOOS_G4517.1